MKKTTKTKKAKMAIIDPGRHHTAALGRRLMRRSFVCSLLLLFVIAPMANSKDNNQKRPPDYALIFGTLWSADTKPVQGATIKIRRKEKKKAEWVLTSDRRGEFAQRVPVGKADYVVWAELPKKKGPQAEAEVHIESNERADVGLHLHE